MTKSPYKNHPVSSIAGCILLFVILVWSSTAEASQVFEPGDKLLLRIAGIVDKVYEVDHAGYVNFELWGGMVQVSDLSTPEAANIIQKQLSRYIKFQGRQPYVSLIKKKFETEESYISVFGEVRFPGSFSYKLNSVALDYILRAGGPSKSALTDKINIVCGRGTQTETAVFNLKEFAKGKTADIPRVSPGCIIYVPKRDADSEWLNKQVVRVLGQVNNPGHYEFAAELNFLDILTNAGGVTHRARTSKIMIVSHQNVKHFNLKDFLSKGGDLPLIKPSDIIYVPTQDVDEKWLERKTDQIVHIFGQVKAPGRYPFTRGFSFMDILTHAGGITDNAESSKVVIVSNQQIKHYNLKKYLENGGDLPAVKPGDVIFIPMDSTKESWLTQQPDESIYLIGEFEKPGRYIFDEKFGFIDILTQAGGPTSKADTKRIVVLRQNKLKYTFNLYKYQKGGDISLPEVLPEDVIFVAASQGPLWVKKDPKLVVNVMGEVGKPGRYEVEPENLNIIDILAAANGPSADADITSIKVIHRTGMIGSEKKDAELEVTKFDFKDFQQDADLSELPKILNGDTIIVPPEKPVDLGYWNEFKTIGGTLGIVALIIAIL